MKTDSAYSYQVKWLEVYREDWWQQAQQAKVTHFPWGSQMADDYRPATSARLGTDGESLLVFMETDETDLRMQSKGFGFVHTDSCMEFFFLPDPKASSQYLNFEFNPAAAMYLSIGTGRHDRVEILQENYREILNVQTAIHDKGWNIAFNIPLSFLRELFPDLELKPGHVMRGNFYKCGDKTARPHYGCWSPIDLPNPDFHCPDFFGKLIY